MRRQATLNPAFTPYGFSLREDIPKSHLGFCGEHPDILTGLYWLGNGYRLYNPTVMRFTAPDDMSPFGKGGLNSYVYCAGDPVKYTDPTGHMLKHNGFKPKPSPRVSQAPRKRARSESPPPPSKRQRSALLENRTPAQGPVERATSPILPGYSRNNPDTDSASGETWQIRSRASSNNSLDANFASDKESSSHSSGSADDPSTPPASPVPGEVQNGRTIDFEKMFQSLDLEALNQSAKNLRRSPGLPAHRPRKS